MAITYSLKCTVPFSFVVPLVSLAVTHSHLLSLVVSLVVPLVVVRCHSLYHSLSLLVIRCHLLSLVVLLAVVRCTTRCHSLSLVVPLVVTSCHSLSLVVIRCHSLSLDVPLACLFINDHVKVALSFASISFFRYSNIFDNDHTSELNYAQLKVSIIWQFLIYQWY